MRERTVRLVVVMVALAGSLATGLVDPRAQERIKVPMIQSFPAMSFATVYVARAQNLFAAEGVELDFQIVRGDSVAAQALVGGSAPMAAIGGTEVTTLASRGIKDFIAVTPVIAAVTTSVAVHNDVLKSREINRAAPVDQRVAALKGLRIATASPGGAVHTVVSYLFRRGGLDPKSDVTLQSVGGPTEMLAALKARQVDAIAMSPPAPETAEAQGLGQVIVALARGDVPELANIPYDVLLVHRDYAAKNPEAVRRVVRALTRAAAIVKDKPEVTRDSLLKYFDRVPPEVVFEVAKTLRGSVAADGRFTEEMWKNQMTFDIKAGKLSAPLETREGILWTNEYAR